MSSRRIQIWSWKDCGLLLVTAYLKYSCIRKQQLHGNTLSLAQQKDSWFVLPHDCRAYRVCYLWQNIAVNVDINQTTSQLWSALFVLNRQHNATLAWRLVMEYVQTATNFHLSMCWGKITLESYTLSEPLLKMKLHWGVNLF